MKNAICCILMFVLGAVGGFISGSRQKKVIEKPVEVIKYVEVEKTIKEPENVENNQPDEPTSEEYENNQPIEEEVTESYQNYKSLGMFSSSAYCCENYAHICNNGNASTTATGTTPTEGRTIAVDPSVIPLGSQVVINGHTYIAEDTGGAIKGKRIDICMSNHQKALNYGIQTVEVFLVQ